jgi:hypothetical protein
MVGQRAKKLRVKNGIFSDVVIWGCDVEFFDEPVDLPAVDA